MSGSYGVLNQKYNTLLAQVLEGGTGGGGGSETLQQVLTNGDTATISAIFDDSTTNTTISPTGIVYVNTTGVSINTTLGDFVEVSSTTPSKSSKMTNEDVVINDSLDNSLMTISSNNINCIKNTTNTIDLGIDTQPELLLVSTGGTTSVTDLAVKSAKLDAYTAGVLGIGETNATVINCGKVGVTLANKGLLTSVTGVQSAFFDTSSAITLNLGANNAGALTISKTGINTNIRGTCSIVQGLKTNAIDTITGTGLTIGDVNANAITLGSSVTTPTIVIDTASTLNTNVTPAIGIGTSSSVKTIKIGNNTNSVHCSSLDLKGSAMNHINNATGSVSIGDLQTDGILNLATGASRTAIGAINIGNTANLSPIDIAGASVKVAIGGSYGTAGQALLSGGSGGSMTWGSAGSIIVNGKIPNPTYNATTPTLYSFPTAFTGTVPNVILTFDNGLSTSPTIIIVGLASVTLSGFYYLLSATAPTGSSLNWFATQ